MATRNDKKRNTTLEKIESLAVIDKWLICVDPDSKHIYSLNTRTNEVIYENVPQEFSDYRKKAEESVDEIKKKLQIDEGIWLFNSVESKEYRRRPIPSYFKLNNVSEYPMYICNSSLSLAFASLKSIDLEIDITEYKNDIEKNKKRILKTYNIQLTGVSLVSSADEVIRNIKRKLYNDENITLPTRSKNNEFLLKVLGFREYMSGSHALLSYDRVRISLRGEDKLRLILTEREKNKPQSELFPPVVERDENMTKINKMTPIDWTKISKLPHLLWYPQQILPSDLGNDRQVPLIKNAIKPKSKANSTGLPRMRFVAKGIMKDFNEQRRSQIENEEIFQSVPELYSGECDWPLRIKLISIENVFKIFELTEDNSNETENRKNADVERKNPARKDSANEVDNHKISAGKDNSNEIDMRKNATWNGLITPDYITKTIVSKEKSEHAAGAKKKKTKDTIIKNEHKTPKLIKTKERESNFNPSSKVEHLRSKHTNHGVNGSQHFSSIAHKYGLNFTPYLVEVEVSLYFGDRLLREGMSKIKSKKLAFSNNLRWSEWLVFKKLKISQLPQEIRACFEISIISEKGARQIIGSTSIGLFDSQSKFNSGLIGLNIWPFYKIDPRLSCMSQYWGMRYEKPASSSEIPIFIRKEYPRLYIQFDTFLSPMSWSLRSNKVMEILNYPSLNVVEKLKIEDEHEKSDAYITTIKNLGNQLKENLGFSKKNKDETEDLPTDRTWDRIPKIEDLAKLQSLMNMDPMCRTEIKDEDKQIILSCRHHCKSMESGLQIFLCAIDWWDPEQVGEVYEMLKVWKPLSPYEAIPLLDAPYPDEAVRMYAVERLESLSDDELALYILELVQGLMFENHHYSPLGEFLLERSLKNPHAVGHELFWQLRSQLHLKPSYERYAILLEQLLMLFGGYRDTLFDEIEVNDRLQKIADDIKDEEKLNMVPKMCKGLEEISKKYENGFPLALDTRIRVKSFNLSGCKVLDSKKKPLWLDMVNNENKLGSILCIFKTGDDLRQDLLTIQLIRIMDKIWLEGGLDYRMKPYRVISTLDQVGMIEVVLKSTTIARIHEKYGGRLAGALMSNTIIKYLKEKNQEEDSFKAAHENFIRSCAGYCVATFLLGIGDRHSGNIMVTERGHLFHIDFGHFLGNFKSKFGIKRERVPFVFTTEMLHVILHAGDKDAGDNVDTKNYMESQQFLEFQNLCADAYNMIRKHGYFLISIFMMMLSAGMPELSKLGDIEYLKKQLSFNLSEKEASLKFKDEIKNSLGSLMRKIDNLIHLWKH